MTRSTPFRWRPVLVVLTLFAVVACGDDDDDASATSPTTETTASDADVASGDESDEDFAAEPVLITGVDYGFEGVPATVDIGTELTFTNASEEEVHELLLLKVDDAETRPLEELLRLPEAERNEVTEFQGVTVAFPGEDAGFTDGSTTLAEPGRYLLICTIPTGADPQAYRDAVADPDASGPPQVDGGPPHLVAGMVAEVEVRS